MPKLTDDYLKGPIFKEVMGKADSHAEQNGFDKWATRVAWTGLFYGPLGARRYAQRRSNYQTSKAWSCYQNLIKAGVFCEEPEGIAWTEGVEPWTSDEILWLNTLVLIAEGNKPPKGFPVRK